MAYIENALIDSSVTNARFTISWAGSNLNLTLKKPEGGIIDPDAAEADANVNYTSASSYEFYIVKSPMPGEWELMIFCIELSPTASAALKNLAGKDNLTEEEKAELANLRSISLQLRLYMLRI